MARVCLTIEVRDRELGGSPPGDPSALDSWRARVRRDVERCLAFCGEQIRATFFFTGQLAEEMPELIGRVLETGHEVGSCGFDDRRLETIRAPEFRAQLARARDALVRAGTGPVTSFRAPAWSLTRRTLWSYEVLGDLGIKYSSSSVPHTILGDRRGLLEPHRVRTAAGEVIEAPLPTVRFFWENVPFTTGPALVRLPFWFLATCLRHRLEAGQPTLFSLEAWELGASSTLWGRLRTRRLAENLMGLVSQAPLAPLRGLFRGEAGSLPIRLIEEQGRQRTFPGLDTLGEEAQAASS